MIRSSGAWLRTGFVTFALVSAAMFVPPSVAAQSSLRGGIDVTVASEHMWRGLSTERPEVQIGAAVWRPLSSGFVGVGVSALGIPLGRGEAAANRVAVGGPVPLNNEVDVWVEYGRAVRALELSVGIARYIMNEYEPDPSRPQELPNTTELYARVSSAAWRIFGSQVTLTPGVRLYYDIEQVGGAYAEFLATARFPVWENRSAHFQGLLGVNHGQTWDGGGAGYFEARGPTLLDLSVTVPMWVSTSSTASALTVHWRTPYRIGSPGVEAVESARWSVSWTISAGRY